MSTTNIDEQKIMQQISSSDTIKDFMEKCNNNFSIISKYGSGPEGKQGVEGSQGVPTKPKVPIHVWREGVEYDSETPLKDGDGYIIDSWNVDLADSNYQEGHLIMLKNGHVYILKENEETKLLNPNYIMGLQSYNQDDIIDGRSAYIHIAFANSQDGDDLILSEELKSEYRKYMGIYSDYNEESKREPKLYTWVRIVGDTGEKGEKGEKGDTPIPPSTTNIKVVGYSLFDLELNSDEWKKYISDLGKLESGTYIYMKNEYTWSDGTITYGKTVTMSGTQGIKGETGRVLFYLGSFEDGTLKVDKLNPVYGILTDNRCDYYIDLYDRAWMRTGTKTEAVAQPDGSKNISSDWTRSEKVGFLQAGAIHADMINANSFIGSKAIFNAVNAAKINADNIITGTIKSNNENSNSYFDLVNNEFVLGDANGAALEYKNNTLTIGGVPSQDDIEDILTRLGVVENIEYNIEVGGRNLLRNTETMQSWTPSGYSDSTVSSTSDTLKGKDAARVTGTGGNDKYKVNYSLMEHTDEHFDTTKPYALSFNFKALNYTQCVKVNLKQNKSDESEWSEVIKLAPNEEKRITFIGYLTENTNLQLCMGAEYWDSDKNINFNADFVINEMKLEYGTVATDWTPAPEDVDDGINNAIAKADALYYLKESLIQDTDIVAGIVATSQIHLRDWTGKWVDKDGVEYDNEDTGRTKQYVYNAGLSGSSDDKVLMWGGGDYLKATQQVQELLSEADKLPILLTKSGENSKIGCLNIVSPTQVEVTGKNNTKIVIDGGTQNASIQLIKNGVTYVKLTSDTISSTDVNQKALTEYTFSGEPFFDIHSASNGAVNKTVTTLDLPANSYSINYDDFSYIRVDFGLHLNNNGPYVKNVKIKFDVYLGSYLIGKCNASMASLQTSSIYTSHAAFIPKLITISKITGGTYDVTIKNASVTCTYGGETKNMNCRVTYVSFGKGNKLDTWTNGDITFTSVQDQMVTIGQNGIQIVSTSGVVQMMSNKGKAYIKMQGLPTDDDVNTLDTGQLYNWNGFLRVGGETIPSIDFSELYEKIVLPNSIFIDDITNMKTNNKNNSYESGELYVYGDGDIFAYK